MNQIHCSSDFPLQLLFEMRKEHPDMLKSTQFVVSLNGEQLMELADMSQRRAEENIERYFERMMRQDISLKRVTTKELREEYGISATRANELQHLGYLTDIIKIGKQNAYLRSEILNYLSQSKSSAI